MRLGEAIGVLQSRAALTEPKDFVVREAVSAANDLAWSGKTGPALKICTHLVLDYLPAFERNPALARQLMESLVLCRAYGQLQRLIRAVFGVELTFIKQVTAGPDTAGFSGGIHEGRYYISVNDASSDGPECAAVAAHIRTWCDRLFELVSDA